MSETVPISITSRGEYDLFLQDRVKTDKLARGVLYVVMLEIKGSSNTAGRAIAEIQSLPARSALQPEQPAPIEVTFKDDDARSVLTLSGYMQADLLHLTPVPIRLVSDGSVMSKGYFLVNEEEITTSLELLELVGSSSL